MYFNTNLQKFCWSVTFLSDFLCSKFKISFLISFTVTCEKSNVLVSLEANSYLCLMI